MLEQQDKTVFRIVRREVALLLLLCTLTLPLFFFTRMAAARYRNLEVEIARSWYAMGDRLLRDGATEEAAVAFRNAAANDRQNAQYTLALATALGAANHLQEAQHVLLRVRDIRPENGEVNLELARLTAKQNEIEDAVHYYHTALYGIWPSTSIELKLREVRIELIGFLLAHQDKTRALSELLALKRDLEPRDANAQVQVAQLFLEADDAQHAREHFLLAVEADPDNGQALSGAGRAEFELLNYTAARKFLRAAVEKGTESAVAGELLHIAEAVLAGDPLAPGIGSTERSRRLLQAFTHAKERLSRCNWRPSAPAAASPALDALGAEIDVAQHELTPAKLRRDGELLRSTLNLIYRIEIASQTCGELTPLDRALVLIARRRGVVEQ